LKQKTLEIGRHVFDEMESDQARTDSNVANNPDVRKQSNSPGSRRLALNPAVGELLRAATTALSAHREYENKLWLDNSPRIIGCV
jgi:hypothetical protein